jgi:hypothetical protein
MTTWIVTFSIVVGISGSALSHDYIGISTLQHYCDASELVVRGMIVTDTSRNDKSPAIPNYLFECHVEEVLKGTIIQHGDTIKVLLSTFQSESQLSFLTRGNECILFLMTDSSNEGIWNGANLWVGAFPDNEAMLNLLRKVQREGDLERAQPEVEGDAESRAP